MCFLCKETKSPGCFCVAIPSAMTASPGFPFTAEQFVVLLIDKLLNWVRKSKSKVLKNVQTRIFRVL